MKNILFLIFFFFTLIQVNSTFATKQTIELDSLVKKADLVIVASVIEAKNIIPSRRPDGQNWLQEIKLIKSKKERVLFNSLNTQIPDEFYFHVGPLFFEVNKKYVLFLKKSDELDSGASDIFKYVNAPSKRVEATSENVSEIIEILQKK